MLNEKDEEVSRICSEAKRIFQKMKQNQEYDIITKKRDSIIGEMIKMYHESKDIGITQAVVISSVFLMDWVCAHNRDYFCEENYMRICCFCIIDSMRRSGLGSVYTEACKLIYGDMTDEHFQNIRHSEYILQDIIFVGKYRESSFITFMNIYDEYIDEKMYNHMVNAYFQTLTVQMKYRFTDMHEEFVEIIIRNSQSTSLNIEIMYDYTTVISR
jgi:hypothetical protein